jgi:DNA-binding transcriptional regulator YiaG
MDTDLDVKAIRGSYEETQATFAERLGVHALTIADWEKNGPPKNGAARKLLERIRDEAPAKVDAA